MFDMISEVFGDGDTLLSSTALEPVLQPMLRGAVVPAPKRRKWSGGVCRLAGLMLASSVPKQDGFETSDMDAVCAAIFDAGFSYIWRLLTPLRDPRLVGAEQDASALADHLHGAPSAASLPQFRTLTTPSSLWRVAQATLHSSIRVWGYCRRGAGAHRLAGTDASI